MPDLLDRPLVAVPRGAPVARPAAPAAPDTKRPRLASLDVLRGLTVVGMIVVNAQGNGDHAFWGTTHARWNGWTPADLVFPMFLFIVGASIAYAFARYDDPAARPSARVHLRILRRTVTLFALGLVLTGLGRVPLSDLHIMGVLQRIALCYLLASLAVLHLKPRTLVVLCVAVLVGYWFALTRVSVPGIGAGVLTPAGNAAGAADRAVLGSSHLYANGPYDPEGLLSTLPATVSVLIGYLTARWLRRQPVAPIAAKRLGGVGIAVAAVGEASHLLLPINKRMWTSSFVLLTAGISLLALAAVFEVVDVRGHHRAGAPFLAFGRNAIVAFMASELLQGWFTTSGTRGWLYDHIFAPTLGFRVGSLAYACVFTAVCWWGVSQLHRRHIVVKV